MHYGGDLREAFIEWVDEGIPPLAACEKRY